MIILNNYTSEIENFILTAIDTFKIKHKAPTCIGIYCCPWAGWLSINFNIDTPLEKTENNCPDFDFVEFELIEFEQWEKEYDTDSPTYVLEENMIHNDNIEDEEINEIFFSFLMPIISKIKQNFEAPFLLQMLDSNCVKIIE